MERTKANIVLENNSKYEQNVKNTLYKELLRQSKIKKDCLAIVWMLFVYSIAFFIPFFLCRFTVSYNK